VKEKQKNVPKQKGIQVFERKVAVHCLVAGRVWRWRRQGRGRRLVSRPCAVPTQRARYIYFCRALYFSLWRRFKRNPVCLLEHLPCESFRKPKGWFTAVPGVDSQTWSPPAFLQRWPRAPAGLLHPLVPTGSPPPGLLHPLVPTRSPPCPLVPLAPQLLAGFASGSYRAGWGNGISW